MTTIGHTLGADIPVAVDLHALRGTHLGVIANSGAGKSGLVRKILEVTHGEIQQIILDPDDEYYTLREGGDYIIAGGEDGDCPATPENAAQLVHLLLTTSISAVIQLNHLKGDEPQRFVAAFITALMEAPRDQWRPILLVLDEAHRFIPQDGSTEATEAVRDLFARGRKRGFTGVVATQRMASIEKMVTANINNWALGRVGQATDRKVVQDALGFTSASVEGKSLMAMEDRVFWMFGRGLGARTPVRMKVADVATTMVESGEAKIATAPAPQKLKKLLQELNKPAPAPQVAEKADEGAPGASAADLEAARLKGYREGERDGFNRGLDVGMLIGVDHLEKAIAALKDMVVDGEAKAVPSIEIHEIGSDTADQCLGKPSKMFAIEDDGEARESYHTGVAGVTVHPISGPQQRILDALAWFEVAGIKSPHRLPLAFMADQSSKSSGYSNNLSRLSSLGLLVYPGSGLVMLTDLGRAVAHRPKAALSNDVVQRAILDKLPGPQQRIMEVLLAGYPDGIARARLAELSGQSPTSSGYSNNVSALRSLGVLDYPSQGFVVATSLMFPFGRP